MAGVAPPRTHRVVLPSRRGPRLRSRASGACAGNRAHGAVRQRSDKARGFYRDLLGFEEAFTLPKPDGSVGSAIIKVNDQQYIELFAEPPGNDGRIHDISFYADDVKALRERLAARGVPVPKEVGKGRVGNPQFTITDPDGHSVELVQYQPGGWSARDSGKFMPDSRISTRIAHVGVTVGRAREITQILPRRSGFPGDLARRSLRQGPELGQRARSRRRGLPRAHALRQLR